MWKRFMKEYLTFTHKERVGIYILLILIITCLVLPLFFPLLITERKYKNADIADAMMKFKISEDSNIQALPKYKDFSDRRYKTYREGTERSVQKSELFYFDPNLLGAPGWRRLGIREKTISTIQKYLDKGGHFYKASEISKIWGLQQKDINRLIPYIQIAEEPKKSENSRYPRKEYIKYIKPEIQPFDINTADSLLWQQLPGIGGHLAKRIIAFREKLGGFASTEQVSETFGLPDSTFKKIKAKLFIGAGPIRKLNINTATIDEMRAHPYIRYALANAIVQYRIQHGAFMDVSGIKNIMLVTEEVYRKVVPYLSVSVPVK